MKSPYWDRWMRERSSRRRLLAGTGLAAFGAGSLALVGCGDDDDDDDDDGNGQTPGAGTATVPGGNGDETPVRGGTVNIVGGPIGSLLDIHRTNTPIESAGIWHRAGNFLMRFSAYPPNVGLPEPDLAMAMPEQPDPLTLTFKLNPAATFQNRAPVNGRKVVAEDVVKSFLRIMNEATTSRGVETTPPSTPSPPSTRKPSSSNSRGRTQTFFQQ